MSIIVVRVQKYSYVRPVVRSSGGYKALRGRLVPHHNDYIFRADTTNVTEMTFIVNTLVAAESAFYGPNVFDTATIYEAKEGQKINMDRAQQVFKIGGVKPSILPDGTVPNSGVVYGLKYQALWRYRFVYRGPGIRTPKWNQDVYHAPIGLYEETKLMRHVTPTINGVEHFTATRVCTQRKLGPSTFQVYRGAQGMGYKLNHAGRMITHTPPDRWDGLWKQFSRGMSALMPYTCEYYLDSKDVLRAGYKVKGFPTMRCVTDLLLERKREYSRSEQECHYREVHLDLKNRYCDSLNQLEKESQLYGSNTCVELPRGWGARVCRAVLKVYRQHLLATFRGETRQDEHFENDLSVCFTQDPDVETYGKLFDFRMCKSFNSQYKEVLQCDTKKLEHVLERLGMFIDYFETVPNINADSGYPLQTFFYGDSYRRQNPDVNKRWQFKPRHDTIFQTESNYPGFVKNQTLSMFQEVSRYGNGFPYDTNAPGGFYTVVCTRDLLRQGVNMWDNEIEYIKGKYLIKFQEQYHKMLECCVGALGIFCYADVHIQTQRTAKKLVSGVPACVDEDFANMTLGEALKSPYKLNRFLGTEFFSTDTPVAAIGQNPTAIGLWCTSWTMDNRAFISNCLTIEVVNDDEPDDPDPEEDEEDDDDDDDDDNETDDLCDDEQERYPRSRGRAFDNTIHPLTHAEEQEEEVTLRENIEENLKTTGEVIYDVGAVYAEIALKRPEFVQYENEAHFVIKQAAGLVNPCDNEEDLKKDLTDYAVSKALGKAGKFLPGGKRVNLPLPKRNVIPASWKYVEDAGNEFMKKVNDFTGA